MEWCITYTITSYSKNKAKPINSTMHCCGDSAEIRLECSPLLIVFDDAALAVTSPTVFRPKSITTKQFKQ